VTRTVYVYTKAPDGTVERHEKLEPQRLNADAGALWGDRSYDGLKATDGSDIGTRTKHREYMRRHGLTTADDFKDVWAKAQKDRDLYRQGLAGGAVTRNDIAEAMARLQGSK